MSSTVFAVAVCLPKSGDCSNAPVFPSRPEGEPDEGLGYFARKSIFQDITQVIVIKQTIEHDF